MLLIAGDDAGIAFPHFEFGAAEGAAAGEDVPFLFVPREDGLEVDLRCGGGGGAKSGWGGGQGFAVEGADFLADVAADDVAGVADGLVVFGGDLAAVFEGFVADAAGGVDAVGGDGISGAGFDAAAAGAAVVAEGGVGREVEVQEEFAQEEPGAVARVDEEGVFAGPAEAGTGGEFAFEDGAGVAVGADFQAGRFVRTPAPTGGGFEGGADFSFELAEFCFDDFVVVAAPGVAGNFAGMPGSDYSLLASEFSVK